MSIGKRFIRLVRSNLNSLLDRADDHDPISGDRGSRIEDLSDSELEAELQRRRLRRDAARRGAEAASGGSYERQAWEEVEDALHGDRSGTTGRYRTAGRRTRRTSRDHTGRARGVGPSVGQEAHLARLYARLECPVGADLTTVRKHYRQMMRKYHPDMHSDDPDKQRLATELSQKLTSAYNELRRALA